jgi:quinol-cytochrome oxidoreductase complex cytochrome b subunit
VADKQDISSPEDDSSGRQADKPNASPSTKKAFSWLPRLYGFGGLILIVFLVQAISGFYLAMFFQPSPAEAWKSLTFIEENVVLGNFFVGLHRWGALATILLIMLHVLHLLWCGAYRKPRGLTWFSGVLLIFPAIAFVITGYLIPWDFRAYWAALTMMNWQESLPLFSGLLAWLFSDNTPGGLAPVARWHVLHIALLPFLTCALFAFHFLAMRRHGPLRAVKAKVFAISAASLLLLLGWLSIFGIFKPNFANPVTTLPYPQPEWLFYMFFQVTRFMQDNLEMIGVFWIPLVATLALFLLPLIAGDGKRATNLKWPIFLCGLIVCLTLVTFTHRTGTTTPDWSCAACHKPGFGQRFESPPFAVAEFSTRYSNEWLALHYRFPQYFWMMDPGQRIPAW